MVSEKAKAGSASFAAATKVERLDSHTYRVNLDDAFCVGNGKRAPTFRPRNGNRTSQLISPPSP